MAVIANFASETKESGSAVANLFTGLNGAGGDGGLALWRVEDARPVFARPMATLLARGNKARTARHFDGRLVIPYSVLDSTTGRYNPVSKAMFAGTWILPDDAPLWVHTDMLGSVADFVGALRTQMASGFAPT